MGVALTALPKLINRLRTLPPTRIPSRALHLAETLLALGTPLPDINQHPLGRAASTSASTPGGALGATRLLVEGCFPRAEEEVKGMVESLLLRKRLAKPPTPPEASAEVSQAPAS